MNEDGRRTAEKCNEPSRQLDALKKYLPFFQTIIDNAKELDVQDVDLEKILTLYDMIDKKKLSAVDLKSCQNAVDDLYHKYYEGMNSLAKNDSKKLGKIFELENPIKNSTSSSFTNHTVNVNFPHSRNLSAESVNEKYSGNNNNVEPSRSIDSNNCDAMLIKNDTSEFPDSRIRLNKFIGLAVNATIEKLQNMETIDKLGKSTIKELAKQVYVDIVKQKIADDILKGVDLQPVDLDTVRQAIIDIQKSSVAESVLLPPLPPVGLLGLEEAHIESIPTVNSISECVSHDKKTSKPSKQPTVSIQVPNKVPSVRKKLNNDINVLHKIGASSKPKQMKETLKKVGLKDINNKINSVLKNCTKKTFIKPNQSNLKQIKNISKNIELTDSNNLDFALDKGKYKTGLNVKECSTKINIKLNKNSVNNNELFKAEHNKLSFTSKKPLGVESIVDDVNKKQKEIVSANEITPTAEATNNPKFDEKAIIKMLANPKFVSVINIFQDERKMELLNKLIENSEVLNSDKNKNISDKEHTDTYEQKKEKKKLKKEKKRLKKEKKKCKTKKSYCEESSKGKRNNEHVSYDSEDDNLNEKLSVKKMRKNLNNDESVNFKGSSVAIDTNKSKPIKCLTNERRYECFEILKNNSCQIELKELKIVLSKLDMPVMKSENSSNELSNDILISNKDSKKLIQTSEAKKPLLNSLSDKLARQKTELSSKYDLVQKYHPGSNITNKGDKNKKLNNSKLLKNESVSSTTNNLINESNVISSCKSTFIENTIFSLDLEGKSVLDQVSKVNQYVNEVTPTVSVVPEIKSDLKKSRPKVPELEKLCADISEIDGEAVLNTSNTRHCKTNKKVDYVSTSDVFSKQHIESKKLNEKQNEEFTQKKGKPTVTKKNKKSASKIKKNKYSTKDYIKKETLLHYSLSGCSPPLQNKLNAEQTIPRNSDNVQKHRVSNLVQVQNSSLVYPGSIQKEAFKQNKITKDELDLNNTPSVPLEIPINSSSKNECTMSLGEPETDYFEYTLKEHSTICEAGGLSCEQVHSVLLYKCSISKCLQNEYSTINLKAFFRHIELSHSYVVWDGMCGACKHTIEKSNEHFLMKDALQHLVSHHLVVKRNDIFKV